MEMGLVRLAVARKGDYQLVSEAYYNGEGFLEKEGALGR